MAGRQKRRRFFFAGNYDGIPRRTVSPSVSHRSELAWRLDRNGTVLPLTEVSIAACSMRIGAKLITTDDHFSKVSGLSIIHQVPRLP